MKTSFATDDDRDWNLQEGVAYIEEDGSHFMRLHHEAWGSVIEAKKVLEIPTGIEAFDLTWRQRITRLVDGERPYFDARIELTCITADGKRISRHRGPKPFYTLASTDGWVDARTAFLLYPKTEKLEIKIKLFTANVVNFDISDITLTAINPAPLRALADESKAAMKNARDSVPDETPQPDKWPSMLKVVGNRLHDDQGNEVWLQGVNASGLQTDPLDPQPILSTVVAIEEWNANCIRLPVQEDYWFGRGKHQSDGGKAYRAMVDKAITLAANRGAYVALDLHRFRAPKQEHADFWKDAAERYKNHPAVLFDLFNEPHDVTWEVWRDGGFVGEEGKHDEVTFLSEEEKNANRGFESVGMQRLVDVVRETGAKNIVIVGGIWWCNDLRGVVNGYALEDATGNGIMYSWHTYHWHSDWAERVLPVAEKHPIFLGEVGSDVVDFTFIPDDEPQENPYTWSPDMIAFIQKYKINWTAWCFHPGHSPVILEDWSYSPTPFWGLFVKDALAGKQFELERMR